MIIKFLFAYFCIGISLVLCIENTNAANKDTTSNSNNKDKRQIEIRQTNTNPHQLPSSRIDTIYGSHPNQFVIQAIGQPLPAELQQQRQSQQHNNIHHSDLHQQPEPTAEVSQQYALVQELQPIHEVKPIKSPRKYSSEKQSNSQQFIPERQQQYIQSYQQPVPQYHLLNPQEELLKYIQDEIAVRALSLANPKKPQNKPILHENISSKQQQGLGNYRNTPSHSGNQEVFAYIQENIPQQYYPQYPIDYHKSIPNHPLAASSLEKELEKLVASNKPYPHSHSTSQTASYKGPKFQQQTATYSTAAPVTAPAPTQDKIFSFFPDFAQLSGFRPTSPGEIYFSEQLQEQPKPYQSEPVQREQKPKKVGPNNNQYLIEKQKFKSNQPNLQQKQSQNYHPQQKEQPNYVQIPHEAKNSAVKVIDAPSLNYEKSKISPPPIVSYYKAESAIPQQQKIVPSPQPSTSSIFVSQGTGIHPSPQPQQPTKIYNDEKFSKIPQFLPLDGRPLTQDEFQALVDAGYPVQAVPVPVPVPYDQYIKQHQQQPPSSNRHHNLEDHNSSKNLRRQVRPIQKQQVTYLHPISRLQQQQEHERNYAQRTSA